MIANWSCLKPSVNEFKDDSGKCGKAVWMFSSKCLDFDSSSKFQHCDPWVKILQIYDAII
jgi:hypothetical protein